MSEVRHRFLLGHDFHDDRHCDNLEEVSDTLPPLVLAPSREFSTTSDTLEGSLIVHDCLFL